MMLHPGARIAVVAPAGMFTPPRLDRGIDVVRSWGYELVEAPNLHATARYTAGTAAERLADLTWALTAPDIDAVWFARGGFGTVHLLPDLPWQALDGRLVIGFSDATALLTALQQHGLPAIHGPVLQTLCDDELLAGPNAVMIDAPSRVALRNLLHGQLPFLPGELLCGPDRAVQGPVVGGNLIVLGSLAGTPWALRAQGAILLLEEINEMPYSLDRMVTQLRLSGALQGVLAVALGDFLHPRFDQSEMRAVLRELLEPLGVPVLVGLPVGHAAGNLAWPVGGMAALDRTGLRFV
jgi:muramoyltetrapeptide carboxypeptidase